MKAFVTKAAPFFKGPRYIW